mmetsp:Transcript_34134/g.92415  ORF Transcript_34134/g.92415 Transcript_34134/m.92415 type:complete len:246 (+) Transcript_34134:85-822(+)
MKLHPSAHVLFAVTRAPRGWKSAAARASHGLQSLVPRALRDLAAIDHPELRRRAEAGVDGLVQRRHLEAQALEERQGRLQAPRHLQVEHVARPGHFPKLPQQGLHQHGPDASPPLLLAHTQASELPGSGTCRAAENLGGVYGGPLDERHAACSVLPGNREPDETALAQDLLVGSTEQRVVLIGGLEAVLLEPAHGDVAEGGAGVQEGGLDLLAPHEVVQRLGPHLGLRAVAADGPDFSNACHLRP